ncbi:hypothetical protein [Microvirga antarctica]|uniref:hypothetical protein n=1 Tax=Microvirga antarctica TaxID=2819233 RepID=UPI001B30FF87|nr:hypothetical protein [Microvirga antarctica]
MRAIVLPAFAFALGIGFFSAPEAQARFNASELQAPSLIEDVACVTRRVRVVRPNGRVVWRTVQDCGVRARPRCRWVQERVFRPNGTVVVRNVQRCSPRRF